MEFIKNTASVCPECLKDLPAEVFEDEGGVFLLRTCPEHGKFRALVEKDVDFYRAAANIGRKRDYKGTDWLVLPVTDRCNQNCKFCFYPKNREKDLTVQQVMDIAQKGPSVICLSGGEPTLHPDLPEMIVRLQAMGKQVQVLTNGLRLEDPGLVKSLKAAGLKTVLFSLNGFSDQILEQIDNAACFDKKMRAIKNLKAEGIRIELSISILRGVNEGELRKAVEFCVMNRAHISGLRVRAFAQVGRSPETSTLTMGEMVALLADALSVGKDRLFSAIKSRKISSALTYCAVLGFLTPYQGGASVFVSEMDLYFSGLMKRRSLRMMAGLLRISSMRGVRTMAKAVFDLLLGRGGIFWLQVKMFSWPDRHCLDVQEINSNGGSHLNSRHEIGGFYNALILDEAK